MRAVMQNRDLAAVSGLPTSQVDSTTFFVGSGLAGVAGVSVALIGPIGTGTGTAYILSAFLVVIVGGLGKLRGAAAAALILGRGAEELREFEARIRAVTAEAVRDAANRYFDPARLVQGIVRGTGGGR